MRRIVCRFEDESDFLKQFRWTRATTEQADFSFVGEFALEPHEQIQLTALVSSSREQCHLRMHVVDVSPMAIDNRGCETRRLFRYRARVVAEDAVWLEAFHQKVSMLHRIDRAAA